MSGISLRGKALWLVPVLAVVGMGSMGCTIKDATNVEHSASARPVRPAPAAPVWPTGGDPTVVALDRPAGGGPVVASAQP